MNISGFLGIHNTVSNRDIPDNALTDAMDCDLTDSGGVLSRNGSVLLSSRLMTSAYSTQNQQGYGVSNGILGEIKADGTFIPLADSIATDFDEYGNVLFTNDGLKVDNGAVTDLRIPAPEIPLTMRIVPGALPKGRYSATYCYRLTNGLMGGSAPISTIEITDNVSGVAIDPPESLIGYEAIVFVSDTNGTVFYDNYNVMLPPAHVLADSFPVCEKIAFHANRLYCSEYLDTGQTVIRYSHTYLFHLFDYKSNLFIVPGKVNDMLSTGQALIIGTDRELFSYDSGALTQLANYGVPAGKSMAKDENNKVFIHSNRGECVALPFENLTDKKVSLSAGAFCSTQIVHQSGIKQFVSVHDGITNSFNEF